MSDRPALLDRPARRERLAFLERLGHAVYRRRRLVLAAAVAVVVVAVAWGTTVFGALTGGGFEDRRSESYRAARAVDDALGRQNADVVALYTSRDTTVDDAAFRDVVTGTLGRLDRSDVTAVTTFWSTRSPDLVSADRRSTYAVLQLAGADEDARDEAYQRIEGALAAPGLSVRLGGDVVLNHEISTQVSEDIARAESLSMPIVLVLLLVIFGSLAAASLPLAVGGLAILGAFTALRVLTLVTDVSIFAINIITLLGLGLAIDYALFVVSRFREELRRQPSVEAALVRTMATAGRTVAFSGLTVAISLASLLLFPQVFLRSMGFGGMAAVLVAMVAALTVLPALLAVLGPRVDALSVRGLARRPRRRPAAQPVGAAGTVGAEHGAWYRIGRSVMRRPVAYAVGIVVVLLALGAPFLRVQFGGIDYRALPERAQSRQVAEVLDRDFTPNATAPIEAVVRFAGGAVDDTALSSYVERLRTVEGVTRAQVTGSAGATARVTVGYVDNPISADARALVQRVRDVPPPPGADVLVGGRSAEVVDLLSSLGDRLPWMALMVALVTMLLLFWAFGSVVLPVKALVMNVLSLSATFGALVLIFQDGRFADWLGYTPTGTIEATQPILVLAIAFGLSMDYEVFLLSRIREEYDRGHDNATAVARGLQRTGGIITSAALLLVIVIGAFSTSQITFIKLIGVGMIVAIVVDATVVRALLVPATMRLLGSANWWAPRPLSRLWERWGLREGDGAEPPAGVPAPRPAPVDEPRPASAYGTLQE